MGTTSNAQMYNCTLILRGLMNKSDVQLLVYSYVQFLSKLGAINISASIKREYQLAYPIQKMGKALFVEILFKVNPKAIKEFNSQIKLDRLIARFFLVKKTKN